MRTVWVAALWVLILGAGSCAGRSEQRGDGTRTGGTGGAGGGGGTTGGSGGAGAGEFGGTGGGGGTGEFGGKGGSGASGGKGGSGANGGKSGTGGFADGGSLPFGKAGAGSGGLGGSGGDAGDTGDAGSGGDAGEGACSCEASPWPGGQLLTCAVPENAICCARAPVSCSSTLDEVLANIAGACTSESEGILSSCTDGTTELLYVNYNYDSDVRIMFNQNRLAIGKTYNGSMCPEVYEETCQGSDPLNFETYQSGDVAARTCEPYCELCVDRYVNDGDLPRCMPL